MASFRPPVHRSLSSRCPGRPGHLSQNRTSVAHIRLFGTAGWSRRRPFYDLGLSQAQRQLCTRGDDEAGASIVTGRAVPWVLLGFGAARGAARGTPRAAPPSAARACAFASSAVPRCSTSCPSCGSTVVAFPPPRSLAAPRLGTAFRRPSGTTRPSDFCRVIVLCSSVRGTSARAGPGRSPWVRPVIFVATSSPIHPRLGTDFGLRRWEPAHPTRMPYGASLALDPATHL